jgi:hypothetical protein
MIQAELTRAEARLGDARCYVIDTVTEIYRCAGPSGRSTSPTALARTHRNEQHRDQSSAQIGDGMPVTPRRVRRVTELGRESADEVGAGDPAADVLPQ